MAKLSRTSRYKDLRDQLDEETSQSQVSSDQPITLARNLSDTSAAHKSQSHYNLNNNQTKSSTGVLDELLGEVKQYNISQGQRVIEDTQFNILETLSDGDDLSARRAMHLEPMEMNTNPGGTTMNMDRINIASFPALSTQKEEPVAQEVVVEKTISEPRDNLQVFDLGADDFDRTIRHSTPKPVKKSKSKRKDRSSKTSAPAPTVSTETTRSSKKEKKESSGGGFVSAILTILIVLILISIAFTIYLIIQTGIL